MLHIASNLKNGDRLTITTPLTLDRGGFFPRKEDWIVTTDIVVIVEDGVTSLHVSEPSLRRAGT